MSNIESLTEGVNSPHIYRAICNILPSLIELGFVKPNVGPPKVLLDGNMAHFSTAVTDSFLQDCLLPVQARRVPDFTVNRSPGIVTMAGFFKLGEGLLYKNSALQKITALGEFIAKESLALFHPSLHVPIMQYNHYSGIDSPEYQMSVPHQDTTSGPVTMFHIGGNGFTAMDNDSDTYLGLTKDERSALMQERILSGHANVMPTEQGDITFMDGLQTIHCGGTFAGVTERDTIVFAAYPRERIIT